MVKTKEHSEDVRKLVVACHTNGEGYDKISKKLNLPKSTVRAIINKFKSQGHVMSLEGRGRKRILSPRDERKIVRQVKQNPRISVGEIVDEQSTSGVNVSRHTVGRVLKRAGFTGEKKRGKPPRFENLTAKWVMLGIQRTLLVVAAQRGIQFFEPDGTLLFWHNLSSPEDTACTSMYARGIAAVGSNFVCVGNHTGDILYFKVPLKGKTIAFSGKLSEHKKGISCLAASDNLMASSDMDGDIFLWKVSSNDVFQSLFRIPGYQSPCSSLGLWNECVVGGYGSGHLRVFCAKTGALAAEVAAHTRWINAVDIAPKTGLVLSAGEDSFVRLWHLSRDPFPQISVAGSQYHVDSQIVGSCFVHDEGKVIASTAYDKNEIMFLVTR